MTKEELQAIRERVNKATNGPWTHKIKEEWGYGTHSWVEPIESEPVYNGYSTDQGILNDDFIAHTREDVPKLLDEIERLQETVEFYKHKLECQVLGGET